MATKHHPDPHDASADGGGSGAKAARRLEKAIDRAEKAVAKRRGQLEKASEALVDLRKRSTGFGSGGVTKPVTKAVTRAVTKAPAKPARRTASASAGTRRVATGAKVGTRRVAAKAVAAKKVATVEPSSNGSGSPV
jgi:hypothetical protein